MGKLHFDNLVIETTRRCNMRCAHCMRGEPQELDIDEEILSALFATIGSIGTLTFTGGEPTLNISAIENSLRFCRDYRVCVDGVNVITNGKQIKNQFVKAMLDWYLYCIECGGDRDASIIAVSQDRFHETAPMLNIEKLRALSFFYPTKKRIRPQKWDTPPVINYGRARLLTGIPKSEPFNTDSMYVEKEGSDLYVHDAAITITVHGDVLRHCDYEYENIAPLRLCSYHDMPSTFERLAV